jgi:ribose 5-phosphate isomerase B
MKIAIGADHGGFELKKKIVGFLKEKNHTVKDLGTFSEESCDYPIIGYDVGKLVGSGKFKRGILICKTGIGMSVIANKVKGVRAALCDRIDIARSSREHNDTNVLVLAANIVSPGRAKKIIEIWLDTKALGGRHRKRVEQIKKIENKEGYAPRR